MCSGDVMSSCGQVRAAFKRASAMLTTASGPNSGWLLSRILRVDAVLAVRPLPPHEPPRSGAGAGAGVHAMLPRAGPSAGVGEGSREGGERESRSAAEPEGFPRSTHSTHGAAASDPTDAAGKEGQKGSGFWGSVGRWLTRPAGARSTAAPTQASSKRKRGEGEQPPSASSQRPKESQGGLARREKQSSTALARREKRGEEESGGWNGDRGSGKRKRGRGWSHGDE